MPASRLPDLVVRDQQPPVSGGVGEHVLEQPAAPILAVQLRPQLAAHMREMSGDLIAEHLQLGDREDPGTVHRPPDSPFDSAAGERGCEQTRELTLHGGDLPPELALQERVGLASGEARLGQRDACAGIL